MREALPVLILIGVAIALYVSATRNPLRICRSCGGTGKIRSWLIPWRYHPCLRCGRKGEIRGRFGGPDK
jgi:hypothetical protein